MLAGIVESKITQDHHLGRLLGMPAEPLSIQSLLRLRRVGEHCEPPDLIIDTRDLAECFGMRPLRASDSGRVSGVVGVSWLASPVSSKGDSSPRYGALLVTLKTCGHPRISLSLLFWTVYVQCSPSVFSPIKLLQFIFLVD